jgi:hypothetical protein
VKACTFKVPIGSFQVYFDIIGSLWSQCRTET